VIEELQFVAKTRGRYANWEQRSITLGARRRSGTHASGVLQYISRTMHAGGVRTALCRRTPNVSETWG